MSPWTPGSPKWSPRYPKLTLKVSKIIISGKLNDPFQQSTCQQLPVDKGPAAGAKALKSAAARHLLSCLRRLVTWRASGLSPPVKSLSKVKLLFKVTVSDLSHLLSWGYLPNFAGSTFCVGRTSPREAQMLFYHHATARTACAAG